MGNPLDFCSIYLTCLTSMSGLVTNGSCLSKVGNGAEPIFSFSSPPLSHDLRAIFDSAWNISNLKTVTSRQITLAQFFNSNGCCSAMSSGNMLWKKSACIPKLLISVQMLLQHLWPKAADGTRRLPADNCWLERQEESGFGYSARLLLQPVSTIYKVKLQRWLRWTTSLQWVTNGGQTRLLDIVRCHCTPWVVCNDLVKHVMKYLMVR